MQSRLVRSRTDVVIAGVCGGLGEYFHVDPVIVRLIFVLVTLTSGIGMIIYPVLWIIMPKAPAPVFPDPVPGATEQNVAFSRQSSEVQYAEVSSATASDASAKGTYAQYGPPFADSGADRPNTGQTIDLRLDPAVSPTAMQPAVPPAPRRRLNWTGIILIGIGLLFLAEQFGIDADIVFPVLMIVLGGLLILRHR